jgi:hypothetical protein
VYLICNHNNLTHLNLKNGNNEKLKILEAYSNPNLFCIEVDNEDIYSNNWILDPQTILSTDC